MSLGRSPTSSSKRWISEATKLASTSASLQTTDWTFSPPGRVAMIVFAWRLPPLLASTTEATSRMALAER